jgi:hypothetical protein
MLKEDLKRTPQSLDKRPWTMNVAVRSLYDPVKPRGVGDGTVTPTIGYSLPSPSLQTFQYAWNDCCEILKKGGCQATGTTDSDVSGTGKMGITCMGVRLRPLGPSSGLGIQKEDTPVPDIHLSIRTENTGPRKKRSLFSRLTGRSQAILQ